MTGQLDGTLTALADPTRRAIVELLRTAPVRSTDLASTLSMSRPAMSRHLRVLREAGLIEQVLSEDDARVRMVHLRQAPFTELRSWAETMEAFWTVQLDAFKAYAEQQTAPPPLCDEAQPLSGAKQGKSKARRRAAVSHRRRRK